MDIFLGLGILYAFMKIGSAALSFARELLLCSEAMKVRKRKTD